MRAGKVILIALTLLAWPGNPGAAGKTEDITLTVFAAASLNEAFHEIETIFHKANPDITAEFSFAGSQQLVQQISEGAPADLFASADMKQMGIAVQSGRIDSTSVRTFAHNKLVIIVPPDGSNVGTIHDLGKSGRKIILADKAVPAGRYSLLALDRISSDSAFGPGFKESVLHNVVSYEENVRAVLAKVILEEADAGIVYVSDINGEQARTLRTIEIPDAWNIIATYPIATIKDSRQRAAAERFVQCVLSKEGQAVLRRFGFMAGAE